MTKQDEVADLKVQALLAEYQYVSGLIPYYRSVETGVLSTMAVILAALAGLIGTLNTIKDAPDMQVQGIIVANTSWLVLLFTAIEVTASLRIMRASTYLKEELYPRLHKVVGSEIMGFENKPSLELIRNRKAQGRHSLVSDWLRAKLVTSAPILLGMGLLAVTLPLVGLAMSGFSLSFVNCIAFSLGGLGGVLGLLVGLMGYRLTPAVERH